MKDGAFEEQASKWMFATREKTGGETVYTRMKIEPCKSVAPMGDTITEALREVSGTKQVVLLKHFSFARSGVN